MADTVNWQGLPNGTYTDNLNGPNTPACVDCTNTLSDGSEVYPKGDVLLSCTCNGNSGTQSTVLDLTRCWETYNGPGFAVNETMSQLTCGASSQYSQSNDYSNQAKKSH